MTPKTDDITPLFIDGMKSYLKEGKEEFLTQAYQLGKKALQNNETGLDIISAHIKAMISLQKAGQKFDEKQNLKRAADYLKESLAPFEVTMQGYKSVINELNKKNIQLEYEVATNDEIRKELQESRDYFQSLIENAQDIITVVNYDGIVLYDSPAVNRVLGYHHKELVGQNGFKFIHKDDRERVKEKLQKLQQNPGNVVSSHYRFKHKDGKWVYIESIAKSIPNSQEGPILVINSRDVTERVKRLQSLKEHKILLAEAQKIAKLGSWKWDPKNGKGLYWSDEMCRIYGVEPNNFNFNYQTFLKYTHEEDRERVHNIIKNAIEEKKSYSFVHKIVRPDQQIRTLLSRGKIMTDEDGNIIKVIGVEQDFTEHEKREKQLRTYSRRLKNLAARLEQTREQERTKLAHEIHEDLGQMLAVLKMDISRMSGKIEKKIAQEFMEIYNKHTSSILERINTIINSVQRITDELRPEVLDDLGYKDAIYWEAKEFGNRQNVEVKFTSNISRSDDLDEKQSTGLFRAFQEALKNVEKHANASKVRIELIKSNDAITLVIEDNGIGITKKQIESVLSHGIIGMRERIERLGGELTIEGGEGTTVTFRLPINRTG